MKLMSCIFHRNYRLLDLVVHHMSQCRLADLVVIYYCIPVEWYADRVLVALLIIQDISSKCYQQWDAGSRTML